jgi:hypothetical protein
MTNNVLETASCCLGRIPNPEEMHAQLKKRAADESEETGIIKRGRTEYRLAAADPPFLAFSCCLA